MFQGDAGEGSGEEPPETLRPPLKMLLARWLCITGGDAFGGKAFGFPVKHVCVKSRLIPSRSRKFDANRRTASQRGSDHGPGVGQIHGNLWHVHKAVSLKTKISAVCRHRNVRKTSDLSRVSRVNLLLRRTQLENLKDGGVHVCWSTKH